MDNWKLGDNNLYNNDNDEKNFTIGKPGKDEDEEDSDFAFYEKNEDGDDKSKKSRTDNNRVFRKRNGFKRIFYVILGIAAVASLYYLFKTFFPENSLNIRLFDLKAEVVGSKVLPENNLVITGYLLNKNSFPISYVKLACKLYSSKNIVLATKHVYAGNFISVKRLKNMSNAKINMKLNNKPGDNMSDMEILPNHPIKFMVVFFDIASTSKNYSITVSHFYMIKK